MLERGHPLSTRIYKSTSFAFFPFIAKNSNKKIGPEASNLLYKSSSRILVGNLYLGGK